VQSQTTKDEIANFKKMVFDRNGNYICMAKDEGDTFTLSPLNAQKMARQDTQHSKIAAEIRANMKNRLAMKLSESPKTTKKHPHEEKLACYFQKYIEGVKKRQQKEFYQGENIKSMKKQVQFLEMQLVEQENIAKAAI
jgi:hypothetical protein